MVKRLYDPTIFVQSLDSIDREHGGIDAYLQRRMGLTPAARVQLAARYLQPAG